MERDGVGEAVVGRIDGRAVCVRGGWGGRVRGVDRDVAGLEVVVHDFFPFREREQVRGGVVAEGLVG